MYMYITCNLHIRDHRQEKGLFRKHNFDKMLDHYSAHYFIQKQKLKYMYRATECCMSLPLTIYN